MQASASDIGFTHAKVDGVGADVVTVNLNSKHVAVRPLTAQQVPGAEPHRARPFNFMVKRGGFVAAINGTFFDPRTYHTLGSLVWDGRVLNHGYVGNGLALDSREHVHFIKLRQRSDWKHFLFAVTGGPTLVYHGRIGLNPLAEGFHDGHLMGRAGRTAIGFRKNGQMLMVSVPHAVSLWKLACMMRALHAEYAMDLDGGSSRALYCMGHWVSSPARPLTNIVGIELIHPKPARVKMIAARKPPRVSPPKSVVVVAGRSFMHVLLSLALQSCQTMLRELLF